MNRDRIILLHNSIMAKLEASLEGTTDFKAGQLINPMAACLVRSAIGDEALLMNELNKA